MKRTVGRVTGVGRFVGSAPVEMARAGWDVRLICARDQWTADSPLSALNQTILPWNARTLEWGGALLGRPCVDEHAAGADWLWNPADSFVAVKNVRVAVTAHTGDWLEDDLPWSHEPRYARLRCRWNLYYRAVRRRRARILAVSEFLRGRLLERLNLPAEEVRVVGHGVESAFFSAPECPTPEHIQRHVPYVLIAGGLSSYKGGDRALAVATKMPDRTFVALGDEPPAGPIPPNVICLGYVSVHEHLPAWYAGALAVLVLSRYETFGLSAAEAMAAGVPVLVSSAGALPEVVADGGIVVQGDQPDEIVAELDNLTRHPEQRAALIARARTRAHEFRWSSTAYKIGSALGN
ncbi:MAG: glycosyltransferase family 4 protein [Gemmataceae bacterium]|nr:glycosyltransferase family 4 protein [Gemmataceae bacterium]